MPINPNPDGIGSIFRNLILAELASRDLSRSWLADRVSEQPDGCSRANTMHYLRGDQDMAGAYLSVVFRILNLHVTRW